MDNFKTADYGLANWLVYRRVTLLGTIELSNDSRKRFVFLKNDSVEEFITEWNTSADDEVLICKRFFKAHNTVKHALKESMNIHDL